MGALTGNSVQSTYLDLVQLGKSGAGLPSHAGKEAALYDGSGAQILGRTAVRHWLDPHPDAAAFAETWEFSTKGTMTQAALEAAGWVFDANTSGSVSGGLLKISSTTGAATKGARLTVSYAGDFDIVAAPIYVTENTSAESSIVAAPFLGIGEATGTGHYIYCTPVGFYLNTIRVHSATTATWAGGTSATTATYSGVPFMYRICRTSGTVYITAGFPGNSLFGTLGTRVPATGDAWFVVTTDSDAATMDVLSLGAVFSSGNAASVYWAFVRRFS